MEKSLTIIEKRIKGLRERIGFTQGELADMLGVSRSLICILENGYANISLKQTIKLAYIYKVPIDYILGIIDIVDKKVRYNYVYDMDLKYIGLKIKEIRKKEKLTQEKFALKLDTKRSNISYYETGKMMISTADLKQLCEAFGYSADYIVGNTLVCIKRDKINKIKTKQIKELVNN